MSFDNTQRLRARLLGGRWLNGSDLEAISDDEPLVPVTIGRHRGDNRFGEWEPPGRQRRRKLRRGRNKPSLDD